MDTTLRLERFLLRLLGAVFCLGCMQGWAAIPQISASSMMAPRKEPILLFGSGLDDPSLVIRASSEPNPESWDVRASLERVLKGEIVFPIQPIDGSITLECSNPKEHSIILNAPKEGKSDLKLIWAETGEGRSSPFRINIPEIRTMRPAVPVAGDRLRLFGVNFGTEPDITVCLVDGKGEIWVCQAGLSYRPEMKVLLSFERTVLLPKNLTPGSYRMFVNSGGGDYGWSPPAQLRVESRPSSPRVFHCKDAPSDGVEDASIWIQKAIHKASDAGGGIVILGPGTYVARKTIIVEKGVVLRGAGPAASAIVSPEHVQIPLMNERYRPVVKMEDRGGLENLTVNASAGVDHTALWIPKTTGVSLRHCEIKNLTPVFRPNGKWAPANHVILATGNTYYLTIEDCVLKGEYPFSHWGGEMAYLTFNYNDCEATTAEGATISFRGLKQGVVEHNHIHGGGRGIVIAGESVHSYFGFNLIEKIHGMTNAGEMFLYEMGDVLWQGTPDAVDGDSFSSSKMSWGTKAFVNKTDGYQSTAYALITAGTGIGQCIPIVAGEDKIVRIKQPWTIRPDASSHIMITVGCMENIHVSNQFRDGVSYSGIYGAGSRNIWAGDEFDRVSEGMMLWGTGASSPLCMNVIRDLRLQERAGIFLMGEYKSITVPLTPLLLGNEIRACQVYGRQRNAGNEYGMGQQVWRWPFNDMPPGNARHSTFGSEAAVHLSLISGWAGNHQDESPDFQNGCLGSSNLVWGVLAARSPVGIRISSGFENTAVIDFSSEHNDAAISNSGKSSYFQGTIESAKQE